MGLKVTIRSVPGTVNAFVFDEGTTLEEAMQAANKAWRDGEVRVNGRRAEPAQEVHDGDTITQAKPPRGA